MTEFSRSINKQRIVVGAPLPFSIYDADRKLLLLEGSVVSSDSVRERLLNYGAFSSGGEAANAMVVEAPALEPPPADPVAHLNEKYGDIVQRARFGVKISLGEAGKGYQCWVIGVSSRERCLVLTAPAEPDESLAAVQPGQKWFCRLFNATTVFRFRGTVLKAAFEPYPYLHIALPDSIERRTVRSVPRALVSLPATLAMPGEISASIVDLSVSGARIGIQKDIVLTPGRSLNVSTMVQVLGKTLKLELTARVVMAYGAADPAHSGIAFYGVRFADVGEKHELMLHAYVQQQLALELDSLGQTLALDRAMA